MLKGSSYETRATLLEFDASTMSPLVGQGAVYLLKPGIEQIRLGSYVVRTTEANTWCAVEIMGLGIDPKSDCVDITVSAVSTQK